jgi:purine-binding chemotaxis protein CheW
VVPVVAFRVGPLEFAADVFAVRRIVPYAPPAAAPGAPPFHEGTIQVGDRAVPVIDLRKRFSLGDAEVRPDTRIMIVESEAGPVGLVVDAARELLRVGAGAIAPPPAAVHGLDARYVQGIIRLPDRSLVLLRTARLLASTEPIMLEATGREEHG